MGEDEWNILINRIIKIMNHLENHIVRSQRCQFGIILMLCYLFLRIVVDPHNMLEVLKDVNGCVLRKKRHMILLVLLYRDPLQFWNILEHKEVHTAHLASVII